MKIIHERGTEDGYFCLYKENGMFFIKYSHEGDFFEISGYNLYGPYNEDKILEFLFEAFIDKVNFQQKVSDSYCDLAKCIGAMNSNNMPNPDN